MKDYFERRRHATTQFCGRVSSETYDAGFENHKNLLADGYKIIVLLNGAEQKFCAWADPEKGEVCRYRTSGGAIVYHYGSAQTETLKGEVVVRLEREMAA